MAKDTGTFHQLTAYKAKGPSYYVMKIGLYHNVIVETVEGVPVDNISEYIHHYISEEGLAIKELATIKDSKNKIVLVYDARSTDPINPMASKLWDLSSPEGPEQVINGRAFICSATSCEAGAVHLGREGNEGRESVDLKRTVPIQEIQQSLQQKMKQQPLQPELKQEIQRHEPQQRQQLKSQKQMQQPLVQQERQRQPLTYQLQGVSERVKDDLVLS